MKKQRYYLHGDQHEDGGDLWYCARCDVFFEQAHFYTDERHIGAEGNKDYTRYQQGLKRLKTLSKDTNGEYYRPADARNCIA